MWLKLADVEMTLKHFFATTVKLKLKTDNIKIDSGFTAVLNIHAKKILYKVKKVLKWLVMNNVYEPFNKMQSK